jgi:hypothetical protein
MQAEDKQPRVIKPSPNMVRRGYVKKRIKQAILVIVALVISITLFALFKHEIDNHNNMRLVSKVNNLSKGWHSCSDGLKQLGSNVSPNFATNTKYSQSARESALSYIVGCTFRQGNTNQALAYAAQLQKLYAADGNKSAEKQVQLSATINYIKSYQTGQ